MDKDFEQGDIVRFTENEESCARESDRVGTVIEWDGSPRRYIVKDENGDHIEGLYCHQLYKYNFSKFNNKSILIKNSLNEFSEIIIPFQNISYLYNNSPESNIVVGCYYLVTKDSMHIELTSEEYNQIKRVFRQEV